MLTKTPNMAKNDLYRISGHWDHYRDKMFVLGVDFGGGASKATLIDKNGNIIQPGETVTDSITAKTVLKATKAAFKEFGELPLLCSGGVARNSTIRKMFAQVAPKAYFAKPEFSSTTVWSADSSFNKDSA